MQILLFLMALILISFNILLYSLWNRSRVREMHCSAVSQLSQTARIITMQPTVAAKGSAYGFLRFREPSPAGGVRALRNL